MDLGLSGHVVAVTGGASGIGRAVAGAFCREKARVALWDVAANVESAATELASQTAGNVIGAKTDVADLHDVEQAVKHTETTLGPVTHLVHCAAVGSGKYGFPFTNLHPDDWRRVLEVNIMGMVHVAHAVAPGMRERRRGTMTFLVSVAGQIGSQTDPPYSAAKAANINFAQCMARDLAPYGVRVNCVSPGMVKTPLNRSVWEAWRQQPEADTHQSYEEWGEQKIQRLVPLRTWQRPQDIAEMIVYLASPRASQVTGQTINVDGGFVMHS